MPKLEIYMNKTLKLVNVLCKNNNSKNIDEEIQNFLNYIKINNIKTRGPLILHTKQTTPEYPISDFRILVQLFNEITSDKEYCYIEEISVPDCIYLKFMDSSENLKYATAKIESYIYENDLKSTGDIYQILIEQSDQVIAVDFFHPIEVNK